MNASVTESGFTKTVLDLAKVCGWRTAHFRPAKTAKGYRTPVQGDGKGWPDLVLVRGNRLLVVELKVGRNRCSREQKAWLLALGRANVETRVWRPEDWPAIEKELA